MTVGLLSFARAAVGWSQIPIGGGGFVTGGDTTADGTIIMRSDTPPALYLGSSSATGWTALGTSDLLPAAQISPRSNVAVGCWEARICPSNTLKLYAIIASTLLMRSGSGVWNQLANSPTLGTCDANDAFRGTGYKMAVDPQNELVVLVGTPANGLQRTQDGGATAWSTLTVGTGLATQCGYLIAFDTTSTVTSGKTQGIFCLRYGDGVYSSTDAGTTWTALNTTGMPTTGTDFICDASGKLWVCVANGSSQNIWTWTSGGGWVQNSLVFPFSSVTQSLAIDPNNTTHLCASAGGGFICTSTNGGSTWSTGVNDITVNADSNSAWQQTHWTTGTYFITVGKIFFDRVTSGRLWQPFGFGVMSCDNPFAGNAIVFNTRGKGVESLDANMVIHPPGGNPVGTAFDLPIWNLSSYTSSPTSYLPAGQYAGINPAGVGSARAWGIDYAKSDSTYLATIGGSQIGSVFSHDKGVTWTQFASQTPFGNGTNGGSIAIQTPSNMVVMCNNLYYTTNGGTSWSVPTYTGGTSLSSNGAYVAELVCADPNNASTYYLYSGGTGVGGIFKSTDSGATWAQTNSGSPFYLNLAEGLAIRLKCVPGQNNHLFLTGGFKDTGTPPDTSSLFWRSTDGGVTWASLLNMYNIWCFSFGTTVSGQTYPTVYFVGWYNGNFGVYKTIDNFTTVVRLGEQYPGGYFAFISGIAADPAIDGACTISFFGGGYKTFR